MKDWYFFGSVRNTGEFRGCP